MFTYAGLALFDLNSGITCNTLALRVASVSTSLIDPGGVVVLVTINNVPLGHE